MALRPYIYVVARADELRAYVRRDWRLLAEVKHEFWTNRRRRMHPVEALRIADDLRAQARAVHPDWPTPADRAADLASHVRLTEILRRAAPAANR